MGILGGGHVGSTSGEDPVVSTSGVSEGLVVSSLVLDVVLSVEVAFGIVWRISWRLGKSSQGKIDFSNSEIESG